MIRNTVITLFGIVPAAILSVLGLGLSAAKLIEIAYNGSGDYSIVVISTLGLLGTAALFGAALFRVNLVILVGLLAGFISIIWLLIAWPVCSCSPSSRQVVFCTSPLFVGTYIFAKHFLGRKSRIAIGEAE